MRVATLLPTPWLRALILATCLPFSPLPVAGQEPVSGEVRQLVTFQFLPGRSAEAMAIYEDRAHPLYEKDEAMLSFRALREVESPVPLDLVVVSAFQGMAGMDASNAALRQLASEAGTSIGSVYGAIAAASVSHDDQFVEMLPQIGGGDPGAHPLVALVWYRLTPGSSAAFEDLMAGDVSTLDRRTGTPTSTGRFLVSDGWHYLRFLGFPSLAAYQDYRSRLRGSPAHDALDAMTVARRDVILAPVPSLSVR